MSGNDNQNKGARVMRQKQIVPGQTEKNCASCDTVKPFTEFYKTKKGPSIYCRPCCRVKDRSPTSRYSQAKTKAKQRDIDFSLTFEEFIAMISNPCTYCKGPLPVTGLGMDRINEREGYSIKNCVPSCAICNSMKHRNFTFGEMMIIGRAVETVRQMRGLGPNDPILLQHQTTKVRRPYRERRKGGTKVNGHPIPLPRRQDLL
jgi:hypothetical protein